VSKGLRAIVDELKELLKANSFPLERWQAALREIDECMEPPPKTTKSERTRRQIFFGKEEII